VANDTALGGTGQAAAALLFMTAVMTTLDAYSTFQSSPWTVENFGGDAAKMRACKEYLGHAVGFSMVYSVASSLIARSPWPVLGSVVSNGYLIWLYRRAMARGADAGSTNWAKGVDAS
jgi:hypothetical protein